MVRHYSAKSDDNQPDIVRALRAVGASVQPMQSIGKGCPDLLVGYRGVNYVLEVKDGSKVLSKRALTDAQSKWHAAWAGQVVIVENQTAALIAIGAAM